jgi:hypothetical protein
MAPVAEIVLDNIGGMATSGSPSLAEAIRLAASKLRSRRRSQSYRLRRGVLGEPFQRYRANRPGAVPY